MTRWEYQITLHQLPELDIQKQEGTIECDQDGRCLVHDALQGRIEWLEILFRQKGQEGWELVQSGYHNRELFCIWKKRSSVGKKG